MAANQTVAPKNLRSRRRTQRRNTLNRILENDIIRRVSENEYQQKIKDLYGGPQGALLATCSLLSLHVPLGERLFRTRKFDIRGMQSILDVGSGAGQIAKHLIKYGDPGARVTCIDLSHRMLDRARQRLQSSVPSFYAADLARLPFADESFDGITCGYVLEHLPEPQQGLAELARVLKVGGRMLLLTTEDNFSGAWTSRVWCCRTYNRRELKRVCESLHLQWRNELWFTRVHRMMRAGGICVEIEKTA
jgi:ubiquinone/menaquinone biosynthesis C-methylase UbiE